MYMFFKKKTKRGEVHNTETKCIRTIYMADYYMNVCLKKKKKDPGYNHNPSKFTFWPLRNIKKGQGRITKPIYTKVRIFHDVNLKARIQKEF